MPCLKIFTNVPKSAIPKDFLKKILPVLSKCVRKPADRFIVTVSTDCLLTMTQKEDEPSIVASLESIGHLGPKDNHVIAKDITDFLVKELGVDKNQIFLTFYDMHADYVAKNGVIISTVE